MKKYTRDRKLIERTGFRRWQNEMKRETCRTGAAFMGNNAHPCFSQTLVVIARARIFIFEHPIPFLYALLSRYANDRNERRKNWEKERERLSCDADCLTFSSNLDDRRRRFYWIFFSFFFFFVEKQWSLETMSNDSTILRTERWRIYNFNGVYSSFIIRGTRVTLKSEVKTIILNCDTCWIDIGIFIEIMKRLSNYCLLSLSERGIDRKSFSYSWQLADEVVVRSWIGNYDLRWMRFNEISICSGATSIIHYTTNWNLNSGRRLESRKKKVKDLDEG